MLVECQGRSPSAPFPSHSTSLLRLRNLHTTLSSMLVYQQFTTHSLEGAGPCHKTWCIVHIAQFSVHGSTRGEHRSQSLPRRGAPEWPKLRALQARRRAESVQMSETCPLSHIVQSAKSSLVKFWQKPILSLSDFGPVNKFWSATVFSFEQSRVKLHEVCVAESTDHTATKRAPRNLKH